MSLALWVEKLAIGVSACCAGLRSPPRQNIVLISAATLCIAQSESPAREWDSKLLCVCGECRTGRRRRHGVIKTATAKSSGCDTVSRGEQRSWWQYLGLSCCTNEDRTALSTHQQPRSHSSQPLCTLLHTGCCAGDHYIVYSNALTLHVQNVDLYICTMLSTQNNKITKMLYAALDARCPLVFCLCFGSAHEFRLKAPRQCARWDCVGLI